MIFEYKMVRAAMLQFNFQLHLNHVTFGGEIKGRLVSWKERDKGIFETSYNPSNKTISLYLPLLVYLIFSFQSKLKTSEVFISVKAWEVSKNGE